MIFDKIRFNKILFLLRAWRGVWRKRCSWVRYPTKAKAEYLSETIGNCVWDYAAISNLVPQSAKQQDKNKISWSTAKVNGAFKQILMQFRNKLIQLISWEKLYGIL